MEALVLGVFFGGFAVGMIGLVLATRRKAKRLSSDGAIVDVTADADGRFSLEATDPGGLDVFVHYDVRALASRGTGIRYGLRILVELERDGVTTAREYIAGNAQASGRAQGAHPLETGPLIKSGTDVHRSWRIARMPPGGRLTVRGSVEAVVGTCSFLSVYVKRVG